MKKIIKILLFFLISKIAFSQNYHLEFQKFYEINDTINQLKILKIWEAKNPKDAELFTSYFNYYFRKSKKEVISLSKEKPSGESLILKDSLNQEAAYLGSKIVYDHEELKNAIEKIDYGIKLYPNRLDMRFGKIYMFGKIQDWENFTLEILNTIEFSSINKNNWTWTNNEKYYGSEKEFLLDIQNYQIQLYNTGDDKLLMNMREIANEVLKHYPNHIESLSNLSITYLLTEDYDKGIEVLLKAEKINPKDYIILSNIAQGYKLKGNIEKSIEYYEKTAKFGDDNAKKYAKEQISALKNN